MNLKYCIMIPILVICTFPVSAQKKIKEGMITYQLKNLEGEIPLKAYLLKGSSTTVAFTKTRQFYQMRFAGGLIDIKVIQLDKAVPGIVLSNTMGRKIKIVGNNQKRESPKTFNIVEDKQSRKIIAGYDCHLVTLVNDNRDSLEVFITNKIKPASTYFDEIFPNVDGFPLSYTVTNKGLRMTYEATAVDALIPEEIFDIPDDYEEMSPEQFKSEMGGNMLGF